MVVEEAALAEEQDMPDAAHAVVEVLDLVVDVVRRAGEDRVGVHQLLHRCGLLVDLLALAIDELLAGGILEHRHIRADRIVAGWIGERFGHDHVGAHVIGDQVGAAIAFLARVAHADHRGEGEAVRRRGPAEFLRA